MNGTWSPSEQKVQTRTFPRSVLTGCVMILPRVGTPPIDTHLHERPRKQRGSHEAQDRIVQHHPAMEDAKVILATLRDHQTRVTWYCKRTGRVSNYDEGRDK
jgi:hypothetical protein